MNAASLFVLRMYMYSMVDTYSFVASTYVCPSVTEPGNEGYRRIYPLKNFRRYAQTTKNLLHKKRTPENFTTRKFPDLRYLRTRRLGCRQPALSRPRCRAQLVKCSSEKQRKCLRATLFYLRRRMFFFFFFFFLLFFFSRDVCACA